MFVYCQECVRASLVFPAPCVFSCLFQFFCVVTASESVRSVSVMYEPPCLPLMMIHTFALSVFFFFIIIIVQTENSHLLTIQPDLTTTTTSYQGTLRSRHDATGKFSMTNGPLLDPLPNGSHTLHNGKLNSDPAEFVSRLSTQSYFKTLPRDVANTSYGTFNFLGGRLTIPNAGGFFVYAHISVIMCAFFLRFSVASN